MKKTLSFFLLLLLTTVGLKAQGGNLVMSEVKLYDMGNGTGIIVVRLSGNMATGITGATFTAEGDAIPGGLYGGGLGDNSRVLIPAPTPGQGNGSGNTNPNGYEAVILTGAVPLLPKTGPGPRRVTINMRVDYERVFYHWGATVSTSNP